MEFANAVSQLSPEKDLRSGQKEVIEQFSHKHDVVAQLPTGYGKTFTGAYCYSLLRERGEVNRILWVVPRISQENQAAEDIPKDIQKLTGDKVASFSVGYSPAAALGQHRKGKAEIFTITVQSLMSNQTLETVHQLMETGRWMLVIDEHHHYGDDQKSRWSRVLKSLPYCARLAMSATPSRPDRTSFFPQPDVCVTYLDAYTEGAVKELVCHIYDYEIDIIRGSGDDVEVTPYRLSDLFREMGKDEPTPGEIDQYVAARKMRWSPKYISPLIHFPVERIVENRAHGIRSQMLIQAMSCLHADLVCKQVKELVPEGMKVDWVGTGPYGRSDDENNKIIRQFCPPKDQYGRRNWELDVLVNVGMAGEGLDTTDVTEVVFLNKAGVTPTTLQIIGRAARIMNQARKVPAYINVDSESGLAELADDQSHKWIGRNVMAVFDHAEPPKRTAPDDEEPDERRDPPDLPEEPNVGLIDVRLVDVWKDPVIQEIFDLERDDERNKQKSDTQLAADIERHYLSILARRDESFNGAAKLNQIREQVNAATSTLASRAFKQMQSDGARVEKSLIGDLRKRINTRMKKVVGVGVKEADEDQLDRHWRLRKELEHELKTSGVPAWLR